MHMLNALEANESSRYFSKAGMFSGVGAYGITDGRSGVGVRSMHGPVVSSVQQGVAGVAACASVPGGSGKVCGINPRSDSVVSERYKPRQFREMWTI